MNNSSPTPLRDRSEEPGAGLEELATTIKRSAKQNRTPGSARGLAGNGESYLNTKKLSESYTEVKASLPRLTKLKELKNPEIPTRLSP